MEVSFEAILLLAARCYETEFCAILFPFRSAFARNRFVLKSNFSISGRKPWTIVRGFD